MIVSSLLLPWHYYHTIYIVDCCEARGRRVVSSCQIGVLSPSFVQKIQQHICCWPDTNVFGWGCCHGQMMLNSLVGTIVCSISPFSTCNLNGDGDNQNTFHWKLEYLSVLVAVLHGVWHVTDHYWWTMAVTSYIAACCKWDQTFLAHKTNDSCQAKGYSPLLHNV